MNRLWMLALCMPMLLAGCSGDGIPMYGLDDSGHFVERYTSEWQFKDELRKASTQVAESTFTALQSSPADRSGSLRSVIVGLGFNLQAGLGPIIAVGVSPKVRFAFSNSKKPIVP